MSLFPPLSTKSRANVPGAVLKEIHCNSLIKVNYNNVSARNVIILPSSNNNTIVWIGTPLKKKFT